MKQTLLLLLALLCLKVNAADTSTQITFSGRDVPLKKIFSIIKEQTGYVFFYRNEDIADAKPVTVSFNIISFEAALNTILKDRQLQ